jgi:hypothetical protein
MCVIGVLAFVLGFGLVTWYVSANNTATRLWNQGEATQEDLKNFLDLTKKKIAQTSQVSSAEMVAYERIIVGQAKARSGNGGGTLATMVTEAAPANVDLKTLANLQNIIAGARDTYAGKQSAALNVQMAYRNHCETLPNSLILSGRPKMAMVIVTSSEVQEAFTTGRDDATDIGLGAKVR